MKKVKLFSFALAALMLGACTNEDVIDNGGQTVLPGEKGYISLSINLPTTAGTRVTYDDGTPNEYAVNDAKLLIFAGDNEADATCQGVYDLNVGAFLNNGTNTDQITSTAQIVQEITKPTGANLYALVVLNPNGLISESMKDQHLSDLYSNPAASVDDASDLMTNGFFMTNAPLYSKAGGSSNPTSDPAGQVTTLSTIDATKICSTETEALNSPAATVYVERALSKVTLEETTNKLLDGYNQNIASYTIDGWVLDNTNKSTYLVRNVASDPSWWGYQNGDNGYRFVDKDPVETGVSLYRTHFGIDPNYSSEGSFNTVGGQVIPGTNLISADGTTPAYCLENTFDVAHMTENNTTRVIVAAKLNITDAEEGTGDFYLLNNNTSVIYNEGGVVKEVKRLWMNHLESIKNDYIKYGKLDADDVEVALSPNTEGGYRIVTDLKLTQPADLEMVDQKKFQDLQNAATEYIETINNDLTIAYYKGGIAYYPVLIKHFGDETPWTTDNIENGNSYPGEDASQKWLGRYGVLRNTWYQLNVTGLRNIGSPVVPEVTNDYDDPGKQYISVDINILPWAVRSQEVQL